MKYTILNYFLVSDYDPKSIMWLCSRSQIRYTIVFDHLADRGTGHDFASRVSARNGKDRRKSIDCKQHIRLIY